MLIWLAKCNFSTKKGTETYRNGYTQILFRRGLTSPSMAASSSASRQLSTSDVDATELHVSMAVAGRFIFPSRSWCWGQFTRAAQVYVGSMHCFLFFIGGSHSGYGTQLDFSSMIVHCDLCKSASTSTYKSLVGSPLYPARCEVHGPARKNISFSWRSCSSFFLRLLRLLTSSCYSCDVEATTRGKSCMGKTFAKVVRQLGRRSVNHLTCASSHSARPATLQAFYITVIHADVINNDANRRLNFPGKCFVTPQIDVSHLRDCEC